MPASPLFPPRGSSGILQFLMVSSATCLVLAVTGCSLGVKTDVGSSSTGTSSTGTSSTTNATVTVSGEAQTVLGGTAQFAASVVGATNSAVTWQVNGVAGGATATGTISDTGLYTAPTLLPSPNTVAISAVNAEASTPGSLTETLLNPAPSAVSATATESGVTMTFNLDVIGNGFLPGAQIVAAGTALTTTFVSSTELTASASVADGTTSLAIDVVNPTSANTASNIVSAAIVTQTVTIAAAGRLLDQATFGPTLTDIQHVQQIGIDAYLTEQFNTSATLLPDIVNPIANNANCVGNALQLCVQSEWWQVALTGSDQLRQRVALALSEMFVVSTDTVSGRAVTPYHNILAQDAFGNFSTLMKDVSLSTAMGGYLNMLGSVTPGAGQIANENYAREFMQLFTTGINLLNSDGSLQLDSSGNPIPVYTQAQVQAFALAYTGWNYSSSIYSYSAAGWDSPMTATESNHATAAKDLLNGTVLPASQTAEEDLSGALANIFAHQNVGPFVCRQLIQHLVTSSPSPAYVARIAAVFADDGTGVRGNLQAVVRAILEDTEARAGDTDATVDGGHLREPMLYTTDVLRGLGFVTTSPTDDYYQISVFVGTLGETPYAANSVFNFFPPNYIIPGSTTNAPEFNLENTSTSMLRLTLADQIVNNKINNMTGDLSATSSWGVLASSTGNALTDSGNLVDALGELFMHGQMPADMRTAIVNHVATLTNIAQRVRVAVFLVITSPQYKIEH